MRGTPFKTTILDFGEGELEILFDLSPLKSLLWLQLPCTIFIILKRA